MDNMNLLPMDFLTGAAECLKVMAHPARLRMVEILMQGEFPVHHIARLCDLPPAQACEHLRLMKSHGLLASTRRGQVVHYRIATPHLPGLLACLRQNCPLEATPPEPKPRARAARIRKG